MRDILINRDTGTGKKRGRKKKDSSVEIKKEEQQNKFFVDLVKEKEVLEVINKLLEEANNKSYGREITFRDLVIYSVPKLNPKDIEKIQEQSLSEMERVKRLLDEHNEKNKTLLTLGEFLVKKLNI
jgi:phospholipid N-methyltransferase